MNRTDTAMELDQIRVQIARLQTRKAVLLGRLQRMAGLPADTLLADALLADALPGDPRPRPGWPIIRSQTSGARISTVSPERIAV